MTPWQARSDMNLRLAIAAAWAGFGGLAVVAVVLVGAMILPASWWSP